ncbi:hypothetical protein Megvenef_01613 [Candidatus Megaera venefica]|uniref:Uncharacterized protein n=1 Tax=Candidatus Megaera venefica TaxID=2055910 RepID=A0ABU5NEN7_9RICK
MRTLFLGTFLEKTIDYINKSENDLALDFGFFLLDWDKALINLVKNEITIAMEKSVDNKKNYTLCLIYNNIGLAICCNYNPPDKEYIYHYCNQAKYIYKLDQWFGCVFHNGLLEPVLKLDFSFLQSNEMDKQIQQVKLVNNSSIDISGTVIYGRHE